MSILTIVGAIVGLILLIVIFVFNDLITKRNRVKTAWAQIDVQLQRRYDLIPKLVDTVRGYMKYEKGVLTQITQLRSSIVSGTIQEKATANNQLSKALKSLFAVVENYPDLKASQNFIDLQEEITNTENKIAFVRTSYNDYVLDYNNVIQEFPGNLLAGPMGFKNSDFFQTPDDEKNPVDINLDGSDGDGSSASKTKAKKGKN